MIPAPNPTLPEKQGIKIDPTTKKPYDPIAAAADAGVLWSHSRAVHAVGTSPNFTAGAPFNLSDWSTLYNAGLSADISASGYPTTGAPYSQSSGNKYFDEPTTVAHRPGVANRRLMNLVIVDCRGIGSGNLSCATLPVKGIGRFFLQTPADLTGNPKKMYTEFAGLIEPAPTSEIKLYR
jgi:hypothetical protein